jgi:hypothetical protein
VPLLAPLSDDGYRHASRNKQPLSYKMCRTAIVPTIARAAACRQAAARRHMHPGKFAFMSSDCCVITMINSSHVIDTRSSKEPESCA